LATSSCSRPGLSFLGLGISAPDSFLGGNDPGIALDHDERALDRHLSRHGIIVTVLSANMVGEALRAALDPRTA
jgi:hypothetical protein